MNNTIKRKTDMLFRASQFCSENPFPANSVGARLSGELQSNVVEIGLIAAKRLSGSSAAKEAVAVKNEALENLEFQLNSIAHCAMALSEEFPGLQERFEMRPDLTQVELLTKADAFLIDAANNEPEFVACGLAQDFLLTLKATIDSVHTGRRKRVMGLGTQIEGTAALRLLSDQGVTLVRRIDKLMRVALAKRPALLSEWKRTQRIGWSKSKKSSIQPVEVA